MAQEQGNNFSLTTFFIKIIVATCLIYVTAWMVDNFMQGRENYRELTQKIRSEAFDFYKKTYYETH